MISLRCKEMVKSELEKLGLDYNTVGIGYVNLKEIIKPEQHIQFKIELLKSGLELVNHKKTILIERIKNTIQQFLSNDEPPRINFSDFLSQQLSLDYTYLSHLFSQVVGTNIERYIIERKIKMVKELLLGDELNLTEISHKLHYSSVAHLSKQFKNETGLTPTAF